MAAGVVFPRMSEGLRAREGSARPCRVSRPCRASRLRHELCGRFCECGALPARPASRLRRVVLPCLVAIAIVFPLLFIVAEADHSCSGDDCPLCQVVSCATQLAQTGFDVAHPAGLATFARAFVPVVATCISVLFCAVTLVYLKVRIND